MIPSRKLCVFFQSDVLHCRLKTGDGQPWIEAAPPLPIPAGFGAKLVFRGRAAGKRRYAAVKARRRLSDGKWYWDLKIAQVSPLVRLLCVPNWTRKGQKGPDQMSGEARARIGVPDDADGVIVLGVMNDSFERMVFDQAQEAKPEPAPEQIDSGKEAYQ